MTPQRKPRRLAVGGRWAVVAGALAMLAGRGIAADTPADRRARLDSMQEAIRRLQQEHEELSGREQGVLGELEIVDAELRLRSAELDEVSLRLGDVEAALVRSTAALGELERRQRERRHYLSFRLREIYKAGSDQALRRVIGGEEVADWLQGLRYAAFLGERDRRLLAEFREGAIRLQEEGRRLSQQREELSVVRNELSAKADRLETTRRRRSRLLEELQKDKTKREVALEELREASEALAGLLESLEPGSVAPELDIRKFRGLLDWPTGGEIRAGFGSVVHPRFQTRVPHPGIDIAAEFGTAVHSVFEGRVVFASWLRGYGLTAIVDHGSGVMSVYAHVSVLVVAPGDPVLRGQRVGNVGNTGSAGGAHLYFELRVDGKPTDPTDWLRPRGQEGSLSSDLENPETDPR